MKATQPAAVRISSTSCGRLQPASAWPSCEPKTGRDAEGEAGRFEALLTEYQKAPRVTRDRLYLEAIEEVYSNSNKIIIDSEGSGNLLYLPLDQLRRDGARTTSGSEGNRASDSATGQLDADTAGNPNDPRDRRIRQ